MAVTFRITSDQKKKRDKLKDDLREKGKAIMDAVQAYNELLEDCREFINSDIVGHFQDEYDAMSEKWLEGERAEATQQWLDTLSEADYALTDLDDGLTDDQLEETVAVLDDLPDEPEY